MGDKIAAKVAVIAAGIPVVPGSEGAIRDAEHALEEGLKIGFPVIVKATAGGGGRGMKIAETKNDITEAFNFASAEALAAFGNGDCYIEKFLTKPRHIEVQIFIDTHGNAVHLFERDCSLQRRHQKVVEEAPAPGMTTELREQMGAAAIAAAIAVAYEGAGTIEFLLAQDNSFYFMEMNTRLSLIHI